MVVRNWFLGMIKFVKIYVIMSQTVLKLNHARPDLNGALFVSRGKCDGTKKREWRAEKAP